MGEIMETLRACPPKGFGGLGGEKVSDYKTSIARTAEGKEERIDLPVSNVLKFWLEGDSSVVVRPSGTEPKLKIYLSVSAAAREQAEAREREIQQAIFSNAC